jgi:hypothetical protein
LASVLRSPGCAGASLAGPFFDVIFVGCTGQQCAICKMYGKILAPAAFHAPGLALISEETRP